MTYAQGSLITAADYNAFRTSTLAVYGVGSGDRGYGQSAIALPAVLGGSVQLIASTEWTALRSALVVCENHPGRTDTTPPAALLLPGTLIKASPPATGDFPGSITAADTNRLVAPGLSMTTFAAVFSNTRSTPWQTVISLTFTATFPSGNAARYFFNSGGQIRMTPSLSGGAVNTQNTRWAAMLTAIGTVFMGAHGTGATGVDIGFVTNRGYYELTQAYQKIYFTTDPGGTTGAYVAYGLSSVDQCLVEALTNGPVGANADNGNVITFRVTFTDNLFVTPNAIDGNFSVIVDERRATSYLTTAGAAYALVSGL